jgi:DNA-binding MarR family transcriptional regulator
MIERFERFSFLISEVSRSWHKIAADEMEKHGLKGTHSIYLTTLYRHGEGVTAARLGELCGRDKAEVSRTVNTMERQGLLQKEGNSYRALLKLTDAGRQAAEQVRSRAAIAVELAGKGLTDEQRTTFYYALELIAGNLLQLCESGLPEER